MVSFCPGGRKEKSQPGSKGGKQLRSKCNTLYVRNVMMLPLLCMVTNVTNTYWICSVGSLGQESSTAFDKLSNSDNQPLLPLLTSGLKHKQKQLLCPAMAGWRGMPGSCTRFPFSRVTETAVEHSRSGLCISLYSFLVSSNKPLQN